MLRATQWPVDSRLSVLPGYTGQLYDADAGLHYQARWYDSVIGKVVSEDPLGFDAGDANTGCGVAVTGFGFIDRAQFVRLSPTDRCRQMERTRSLNSSLGLGHSLKAP